MFAPERHKCKGGAAKDAAAAGATADTSVERQGAEIVCRRSAETAVQVSTPTDDRPVDRHRSKFLRDRFRVMMVRILRDRFRVMMVMVMMVVVECVSVVV